MALPHRYDVAEQTIIQCAPNQPPWVPQVSTIPEVMYLLPVITSAIVNEVGAKAYMSPARMFTFNLWARNNWQNDDFGELVAFTANTLAVNFRKGAYRSPEHGIQETVGTCITVSVSQKIFQYPDLKMYCAPEVVNAAMMNVQVFQNMMAEIQSLFNSMMQGQQFQPMQQFQPVQQFQQVQQFGGGRQHFGPGMQQNTQQFYGAVGGANSVSFGSGNVNNQLAMDVNPVNQSAFMERFPPNRRPAQTQEAPKQPEVVRVAAPVTTEASWKSSPLQPYKTLVDESKFKKSYVLQDNVVTEIINPLGADEMDRNKHAITLLGETYSLDGVMKSGETRVETVGNSAAALSTISRSDIEVSIKAPTSDTGKAVAEFIDSVWTVDPFLESAIFEGRLKQRTQRTKNTLGIFRCFSTVAKPYVTLSSYKDVIGELAPCRRFIEMASKLKALGQSATQISSKDEEKQDQMTDMVLFCHEIDTMLTKVVNDFLANKMSITTRIGDFVEDVGELRKYLEKVFGPQYSAAYDRFEYDVTTSLFPTFNDETELQLSELLTNDRTNADGSALSISFIPTNYSLTFIDMLDAELKLNIKSEESLLIRESITPTLFHTVRSLFEQPDLASVYDLLITSDNVIYQLHKGYLGLDSYLISKNCC